MTTQPFVTQRLAEAVPSNVRPRITENRLSLYWTALLCIGLVLWYCLERVYRSRNSWYCLGMCVTDGGLYCRYRTFVQRNVCVELIKVIARCVYQL